VQIPSTIQQLAFPAQTPVARREHTSSLTWKKEMLTVALGQTPNRDKGSQKKKELRRRKSKPALPNSKSFAEDRASLHCQTPRASQKKARTCTAKLQKLCRRANPNPNNPDPCRTYYSVQ
jgi:hypothetical protein